MGSFSRWAEALRYRHNADTSGRARLRDVSLGLVSEFLSRRRGRLRTCRDLPLGLLTGPRAVRTRNFGTKQLRDVNQTWGRPGEHQSDATIEFISSSPAYPLDFISGVPNYFICHRMFRDMGPENTVVAIQTGRLNLVFQAESFLQFLDGNRLDSGHEGFLRELTKLMDTHFNFAMQVNS